MRLVWLLSLVLLAAGRVGAGEQIGSWSEAQARYANLKSAYLSDVARRSQDVDSARREFANEKSSLVSAIVECADMDCVRRIQAQIAAVDGRIDELMGEAKQERLRLTREFVLAARDVETVGRGIIESRLRKDPFFRKIMISVGPNYFSPIVLTFQHNYLIPRTRGDVNARFEVTVQIRISTGVVCLPSNADDDCLQRDFVDTENWFSKSESAVLSGLVGEIKGRIEQAYKKRYVVGDETVGFKPTLSEDRDDFNHGIWGPFYRNLDQ